MTAERNSNTDHDWLSHPAQAIEVEARDLHEVEQAGESPATPLIALLGLLLVLVPAFLLLAAIGFTAYYLAV